MRQFLDMSPQSLMHFIACRPARIGAAALGYLAPAAALLHGIVAHIRLESSLQPVAAPAAASRAGFVDPCVDAAGLERKLCKAEMKVETAHAKLRQRQARRQAERTPLARETMVWTPDASQAALRPRELPDRAAPESKPQRLGQAAGAVPARSFLLPR